MKEIEEMLEHLDIHLKSNPSKEERIKILESQLLDFKHYGVKFAIELCVSLGLLFCFGNILVNAMNFGLSLGTLWSMLIPAIFISVGVPIYRDYKKEKKFLEISSELDRLHREIEIEKTKQKAKENSLVQNKEKSANSPKYSFTNKKDFSDKGIYMSDVELETSSKKR
ncbi:MAG: hypothetical protein IJE89_05040 [Bacilli bacterium]|nr:hypothetical protein [Bacilli bacterium]